LKEYSTGKLRNIALISHGGAGKTSLVEGMLFKAGLITRLGRVDDGNTTSDYLPEEIKRKVSINTSLLPCLWKDYKINFLDTPGFADFVGEVKGSLRAADSGLVVVCGVAGVEVQTEIVWEFLDELDMPRMIFVNKMDRENANFFKTLEMLTETFPCNIVPVQLPIGIGETFNGIVDILSNKAFKFSPNGDLAAIDLPEEMRDIVSSFKESLVEAIAECDDELLMSYLDGEELSPEQLNMGLQKGISANKIVPVLCGSATNNWGADLLLDNLIKYAPVPKVLEDKGDKLMALVFKTMADPYVGKLNFFKVLSGKFNSDSVIYNVNKEVEEKVGQVFTLLGKNQQQFKYFGPGDIGAVAKLQQTGTGDTISTKGTTELLESIAYPTPTYSLAVFPKSKGDEDKLGAAIVRILEEDPTLSYEKNLETKEAILKGMGDLHVDIVIERLQRKFAVEVTTSIPKVPYRETIKSTVKIEGKHKKQSGGHGQYGHVWLMLEPYAAGEFFFKETIFGGSVPKQYIPAVEKGLRDALTDGILAGYPVTNIRVTLVDGSYHPVDSSEMAFKIAASLAFRKGAEKANPVLLEPVMEVAVTVPESFMGDIIGDLNSKRGRILGMEPMGKMQVIKGHVPLSELGKYAIDLKSITQGRGTFTMELAQYEEVPPKIAEEIISSAQAKTS
jgi:elongation factor G